MLASMAVRPTGTVTFLFTDVEESTRLWAADSEAMSTSLLVHDSIVRHAIESAGGYVFTTAGDSFAAAFARASDAVSAAQAAQSGLEAAAWPGPVLRVRIGLHLGEAEERGGDFFGPTVNTAARVEAAAHGGQTLITEAVRSAARVTATDLGVHLLRDVTEPMRLFQLGVGVFPPLRVVDAGLSNLPVRPTRLIGRDRDVINVRRLLDANRLVTVTAVGGAGKTRLAIAVGEAELPHRSGGVWFVDLTAVMSGTDVIGAIAGAIGLSLGVGDAAEQVIGFLADRAALVVLDNCEHVVDDCAQFVQRFLSAAGKASVLATSREALDVDGEQVVVLGSLACDGADSPGVRLFVDRATAVNPMFELTETNAEAVAEVCSGLDGIPLAIELAAARVTVMTPADLAAGLRDRFELLSSGRRRQRQRTLQATLDWSYDLLDVDEQHMLRALGVFVDGFDIEAAAAVTTTATSPALSIIEELVAKSLVVRADRGHRARFTLLETVKAYAEGRLTGNAEATHVRNLHLAHFHRLASIHGRMAMPEIRIGASLRHDRSNITAAFEWATVSDQPVLGGELLLGAAFAYVLDDAWLELKALTDRAIAHCATEDLELADYLRATAVLIRGLLQDSAARPPALAAAVNSTVTSTRVYGLSWLGLITTTGDDPERGRALLAQARSEVEAAQRAGPTLDVATAGLWLSGVETTLVAHSGDYPTALATSLDLIAMDEANDYRTEITIWYPQLAASCQIILGEPDEALRTMDRTAQFELTFLDGDAIRAVAHLALGEIEEATRQIRAHAKRAATRRLGGEASDSVLLLAALAYAEGQPDTATDLLLQMSIGRSPATQIYAAHLADTLGLAAEYERHTADVRAYGPESMEGNLGRDVTSATMQAEVTRRGWH